MTTLQKTIIGVTLAAAVGTGIHEARRASRLGDQLQSLQQQRDTLAEQVQQLTSERDRVTAELGAVRGESQRLRQDLQASSQAQAGGSGDPSESSVKSWLARIKLLRQRLEETPLAKIPELQFLTDLDWVEVAANTTLETDADYRKALAKLRDRGGSHFSKKLGAALGEYMKGNNGQWPDDVSQLEPYFDPPVERALWARWEIVSHTAFPGQEFAGDRVITEKSAVDPELDYRHWVDGPGSGGGGPYHPYGYEEKPSAEMTERLALKATLEPVLNAYRLANGGKEPGDPFQLQHYVTDTTQQVALQRIIEIINQPHK